jgi:hypothetical protein
MGRQAGKRRRCRGEEKSKPTERATGWRNFRVGFIEVPSLEAALVLAIAMGADVRSEGEAVEAV